MKTDREKIVHRMKIIKGHVNAIERMIENDQYCVDIVLQSLAVQKALKKLDMAVIEQHMKSCVVDQIKDGNVDDAIKELMEIYKLN